MKAKLEPAGLLLLRASFGLLLALRHGLPKLLTFSEKAATFPDPLHVGHGTHGGTHLIEYRIGFGRQGDFDKDQQIAAKRSRIHTCVVAGDHAFALHAAHPFRTR